MGKEGEERGKSREVPPGMKMEFTADCKEWWMGEFVCWHRNVLWKNKTKQKGRGLDALETKGMTWEKDHIS